MTIQLRWGAHAPSRAVVGTLADHTGACKRVSVWLLDWAFIPTGGAPAGTREGAYAPQFGLHTDG